MRPQVCLATDAEMEGYRAAHAEVISRLAARYVGGDEALRRRIERGDEATPGTVSRLAAMFSQDFAKRPLPVEDFLGHTFSSMFETELNRAGKSRKKQARKGEVAEVPLRHEEMDALFGGGGAVAVLDFAA